MNKGYLAGIISMLVGLVILGALAVNQSYDIRKEKEFGTPVKQPSTSDNSKIWNANLTDAQLIQKAQKLYAVALYVSKHPNAKPVVLREYILVSPHFPLISVNYYEFGKVKSEPAGIYRSFSVEVGFDAYSNDTGQAFVNCDHFTNSTNIDIVHSPYNYSIPTGDVKDFIAGNKCFQ